MRHFTVQALSVSILMSVLLFSIKPGRGQNETPPFEIRLPSEVRSEQVQVRYFLTGPFGGNGGFLKAEPERNSYLIETSVNHQAAESLKAILYAPGCQIVTLSVASISEAEKGADVTCEDLPPMTFNGRVDLPEALRGRPYEIEITYLAYWAHSFFRIADGPVTSFVLARVQPDESGAFHVELPNFNKDRETVSYRRDAGLQFIARELDTGNIVASLAPANVQGNGPSTLPIKPKYPAEVIFKPAPESPQNPKAGPAGKDAQ
jgi:hypothetical protein